MNNKKGESHIEVKRKKEKKKSCMMDDGGIDKEYRVEGYTYIDGRLLTNA